MVAAFRGLKIGQVVWIRTFSMNNEMKCATREKGSGGEGNVRHFNTALAEMAAYYVHTNLKQYLQEETN